MTPEEEKIVAHNMRCYIEESFNARKHNGVFFVSPPPKYVDDALAIVKLAMDFGKQCFEVARNTHGDSYDNGDYIYDEFEDYIKSFSEPITIIKK